MERDHKQRIEEIIGTMKCPKNFLCYQSGTESLCRARDIGIESFLVCLESNTGRCEFSVSFGNSYFCQCPLRVYIAKKLRK